MRSFWNNGKDPYEKEGDEKMYLPADREETKSEMKSVKELYEEWLDGYIATGGKVRITSDTMPNGLFERKPWEIRLAVFYVVREDGVIERDSAGTFIIEEGGVRAR